MRTPLERAKRFVRHLANGGLTMFRGQLLIPDETVEFLAEEIADAQEEVRQGFLKPPSGRSEWIHK